MKICMLSRSLPAHAVGGMELHIEDLASSLVKKGHSVSIITTQHPWSKEFEVKEGVNIYYIRHTKPGKYSSQWWKRSIEKFEELHRTENFNLIHSQSAGAYYLLRKRVHAKHNIPTVVSMHGTAINEIRTKINLGLTPKNFGSIVKNMFSYLFWDRIFLKEANAIIATSNQQEIILEKYYHLNKKKIFLIYNGINTSLFKPRLEISKLEDKYNPNKTDCIILCLARIKKEKGIQIAVKALPYILKNQSNVKLLIVGEGEYKVYLQKLVKNLGLEGKVIFETFVDYNKLPLYFNLCDIFINSTIRENGYDLTILQAMACGKVVISSNLGSIPTVIKDAQNGLLFPMKDFTLLAKKVEQVLSNNELKQKIEKEARNTIQEKFSLENMTNQTIQLYENLLQGVKNELPE